MSRQCILLPHFLEAFDEVLAEAGRAKDLRAAVSTAGDDLPVRPDCKCDGRSA